MSDTVLWEDAGPNTAAGQTGGGQPLLAAGSTPPIAAGFSRILDLFATSVPSSPGHYLRPLGRASPRA